MAEGLSSAEASSLLDDFETRASYVQLHKGAPGAAGTSNTTNETTRKQITSWNGSGASRTNGNLLTWTSVAVASGTDTYTHASIWTLATGGAFRASGSLTASGAVSAGDTFQVAINGLTVTLPTAS